MGNEMEKGMLQKTSQNPEHGYCNSVIQLDFPQILLRDFEDLIYRNKAKVGLFCIFRIASK